MAPIWQELTTGQRVEAAPEMMLDFAAYVCGTGKDYETEQITEWSAKERAQFIEAFPEYTNHTAQQLFALPEDEAQNIVCWFFSGNWFQDEV